MPHQRRRSTFAIVASVLVVLLAWSGMPPGSAHRTRPAHRAAAGKIIVHGHVTFSGGAPIRNAWIDAFLLTHDPSPRRLDGARTTSRGDFRLAIERGSGLARYAAHHNGRLNVVLWVFKAKRIFLRAERVRYHSATKSPIEEVHLGRTPMLASQPLRGRRPPRPQKNGEVIDTHWDTIGRISASEGFTTQLRYYRNLETAVSFGIAHDGKLDISGSMQIGESSGVSLEPTLRGYLHARQSIQIEIDHRRVTACEWRPWMQIHGQACVDYVLAEWNSHFRSTHEQYRGCGTVPIENQLWVKVNRTAWNATKTEGKSFVSEWGIAGLGGTVQSSTAFSETNLQHFHMPNRSHTPVANFCVAGIDGGWDEASEVLTESRRPEPPCPPVCRRR